MAFGTELALEKMRECGCAPRVIAVAGGATKSALWMQAHADVCGLPLQLTEARAQPQPLQRPRRPASAVAR